MQQLSLSPVMCNDRAGGAGCVALRSVTWSQRAAKDITTPGPTVKAVHLCHQQSAAELWQSCESAGV